jgi:hypothetical protein
MTTTVFVTIAIVTLVMVLARVTRSLGVYLRAISR